MCVLPFLNPIHREPIPSFISEWLAALLAFFAVAPLFSKRLWNFAAVPRAVVVPLGLVFLLLVQMVIEPPAHIAFPLLAIGYLLAAVLLMILGASLRCQLNEKELVHALAVALALGGIANASIALLQALKLAAPFGRLIAPGGTVFGNIAQANHLCDFLALAIASTIYLLAVHHRNRGLLAVGLAAIALELLALALSASRASFLYLGAATAGALFLHRRHPDYVTRRTLILAVASATAFIAIQPFVSELIAYFTQGNVAQLPTSSGERLFHEVKGYTVRLRVWYEAVLMFLQSPWLGIGFGEFAWHHFLIAQSLPLAHDNAPFSIFNNAHNLPLHLLAELGIGAWVILGSGGFMVVRQTLSEPATPERWWIYLLLTVIGIHSMLEYPLWYFFFLAITAVLFGVADPKPWRGDVLVHQGRRVLLPVFVALGAFFVHVTDSYIKVEVVMAMVSAKLVHQADVPLVEATLQQLRHGSIMAPYAEQTYERDLSIKASGNLDPEIDLSRNVMQFWPSADVIAKHVVLLALNRQENEAKKLLNHGRAAFPDFDALVRGNLAMVPAADAGAIAGMVNAGAGAKAP